MGCALSSVFCTLDLWKCQSCGKEYCTRHSNETDKGKNVECVSCYALRIAKQETDKYTQKIEVASKIVDVNQLTLAILKAARRMGQWSWLLHELSKSGFSEKLIMDYMSAFDQTPDVAPPTGAETPNSDGQAKG